MTFKPETFWSLTCDWPECGRVLENDEMTSWIEIGVVVDEARDQEWYEAALAKGWFCPDHPMAIESDPEAVASMTGPYLLIHDNTEEPAYQDGQVTYVQNADG